MKESKEHVDELIPIIFTYWNPQELIYGRSEGVWNRSDIPVEKVKSLFRVFSKQLGPMKEYRGAVGAETYSSSASGASYKDATYRAEVLFEKAPATIEIDLHRFAGCPPLALLLGCEQTDKSREWMIWSIQIKSKVLSPCLTGKDWIKCSVDQVNRQTPDSFSPRVRNLLKYKKCVGCDLRNIDLSYLELDVPDRREAYLSGATMPDEAQLRHREHPTNLTNANMSGAKLSYTHLSGAQMKGVNLSGANLTETELVGVNLSGANLRRANLTETRLDGANLSQVDLTKAYLTETRLGGANLSQVDLTKAYLDKTQLYGANLTEVNLSEAWLTRVALDRANLKGVNLSVARFKAVQNTRWFNADLTRANLSRLNLAGIGLSGASLTKADLTGTNLSGADLGRARLKGANLSKSNLVGANFRYADLTEANLTGANLNGAKLTGTIMPDGTIHD